MRSFIARSLFQKYTNICANIPPQEPLQNLNLSENSLGIPKTSL